jgi:hypothetical protein
MSARLRQSLLHAEAVLDVDAQNRLADIVERFMSDHGRGGEAPFTPEEVREFETVGAGPFESADPEEVRAFFARDGA